jgi:hypothetical protein
LGGRPDWRKRKIFRRCENNRAVRRKRNRAIETGGGISRSHFGAGGRLGLGDRFGLRTWLRLGRFRRGSQATLGTCFVTLGIVRIGQSDRSMRGRGHRSGAITLPIAAAK